jgi:hypothetical protein
MAFQNCGLRSKIISVLTALEANYGIDPLVDYVTVFANTGADFKMENDMQERTMSTPNFSPVGKASGVMSCTSTIPVEFIGGGVDGSGKVQAPFYDHLMQASGLVRKNAYLLVCTGSTGTWSTTESVSQDATKAVHVGTANLSSGHDWSATSQTFSINVSNAGDDLVTLDSACASVADVVTEVNSQLSTAGVSGVEAYASGNYVAIRTTAAGATQSFVLSAGSPNALTTLGWTAGTYTGTAASSGTLLDFKSGAAGAVTLTVTTSTGEFGTGTITGAGGASATVTSAVDGIAYVPTSSCVDMKSISMHYMRDSMKHISSGIRADPSFTFEVGKLATASFALTGTYTEPSNATLPSATVPEVLPTPMMGATVVIGDLASNLLSCSKLELKMANAVAKHMDITDPSGMSSIGITGRKPTGSIDPLAPSSLTDFNPIGLARAGTTLRIEALFGTTHGNRFKVVVPYAQLDMPDLAEREELVAYNLSFTCTGKKGDDEFYILFI